jgi:hypothetical protein
MRLRMRASSSTLLLCRRCQNKELLRMMAYCSHSHVLSSSNNNTQCKRKLVRLRMKELTPTYDVVAAAVSSLSPPRVG